MTTLMLLEARYTTFVSLTLLRPKLRPFEYDTPVSQTRYSLSTMVATGIMALTFFAFFSVNFDNIP